MVDLGRCQLKIPSVCTQWATNRHHRKLRKHGGTDEPVNLIDLCGSGTTGCHGYVHHNPAISFAKGWLVHSWDDPAEVPWEPFRLKEGIL